MENLKVGDVLKSYNGKEYAVADVKEEQKTATETEKIAIVVDKATKAIYWIPFSWFNENKFKVVSGGLNG